LVREPLREALNMLMAHRPSGLQRERCEAHLVRSVGVRTHPHKVAQPSVASPMQMGSLAKAIV
jgi:hypothetical protein